MSEQKKVTIAGIKARLNAGKTRKEIAEEFGTTVPQLNKHVFSHPELKGLKTKKKPDVVLVTEDELNSSPNQSPSTENASLTNEEVEASEDLSDDVQAEGQEVTFEDN